jgi:hypothetical protein
MAMRRAPHAATWQTGLGEADEADLIGNSNAERFARFGKSAGANLCDNSKLRDIFNAERFARMVKLVVSAPIATVVAPRSPGSFTLSRGVQAAGS